MSLAEKLNASEETALQPGPAASNSIDNILRLALNGGRARAASRATLPGLPDYAAAVDVLDKAAGALSTLQARCERLEQQLASETQRFAAELQTSLEQAREWERRATSIKAQLYDSESLLSEAEVRAEAAARRAEAAEARAKLAEQQAADTAAQAKLFHDKIMTTFASCV